MVGTPKDKSSSSRYSSFPTSQGSSDHMQVSGCWWTHQGSRMCHSDSLVSSEFGFWPSQDHCYMNFEGHKVFECRRGLPGLLSSDPLTNDTYCSSNKYWVTKLLLHARCCGQYFRSFSSWSKLYEVCVIKIPSWMIKCPRRLRNTPQITHLRWRKTMGWSLAKLREISILTLNIKNLV